MLGMKWLDSKKDEQRTMDTYMDTFTKDTISIKLELEKQYFTIKIVYIDIHLFPIGIVLIHHKVILRI